MSDQAAPAGSGGNVRRVVTLNIVVVVVILIIALIVFYFWHQGYYFYSTDDATVTSPLGSVVSTAPGTITSISKAQGDSVSTSDTIATVSTMSGTVALKSPINGVIVQEPATAGQVVVPGQTVAQVVSTSTPTITAYVEETHINDVALGQGVDVKIDAVPDTTFHGTVTRILPVAASALSPLPTTDYASGNFTKVTQRVPVQITLDGTQGHTLYPGTSAQVTIHLHT